MNSSAATGNGIFLVKDIQASSVDTVLSNSQKDLFQWWIITHNVGDPDSALEENTFSNTLCYLPAGYRYNAPLDLLNGFVFIFDDLFIAQNPYLQRLDHLIGQHQDILPIIRQNSAWFDPLYFIGKSATSVKDVAENLPVWYPYLYCTLAANHLFDFLTHNIPWVTPMSRMSKEVQQFLALVENHHETQHRIAFYLRALHVSDSLLLKHCQRDLRKTPTEVIQQRIIKTAKYLLIHTDLPIKVIADQLNFNSDAYFSERFKFFTTLSPGVFRNLNRL